MNNTDSEKMIGFQRLVCKNPTCHNLLKKIEYTFGWKRIDNGSNGSNGSNGRNGRNGNIPLIKNNGTSYYVCPECGARNFVIFEGEKIILEKIIYFELDGKNRTEDEKPNLLENSPR